MSNFDISNITKKLKKILEDPKPNTCREDKLYNAGFNDALEIALDMINQEAKRCNCQ